MNIEEIIKEDLIFTRKHFESKEGALRFGAEQLRYSGYVYETFTNAVIEREEKYPTGLYLGEINVAIPHTDTKHVKQSGIAILTLDKPVIFNRMDDPSKSIPVVIIFLLAVSDPNEYVGFLSKIAENLFKEGNIKKIYKEPVLVRLKEILRGIVKDKAGGLRVKRLKERKDLMR